MPSCQPPVRNINSLNSMLRNIRTPQDLVARYAEVAPRLVNPESPGLGDLFYCSGAAIFVINYLTRDNNLLNTMVQRANQRVLKASTAENLFNVLKKSHEPYLGYLVWEQTSHECVLVHTGSQWAFYQANHSSEEENFTLAPHLNRQHRNWCLNDMNARQFEQFFRGLTKAESSRKYFPYKEPPEEWVLAAYTFQGVNLLSHIPSRVMEDELFFGDVRRWYFTTFPSCGLVADRAMARNIGLPLLEEKKYFNDDRPVQQTSQTLKTC
jgi:hypothetical protein